MIVVKGYWINESLQCFPGQQSIQSLEIPLVLNNVEKIQYDLLICFLVAKQPDLSLWTPLYHRQSTWSQSDQIIIP